MSAIVCSLAFPFLHFTFCLGDEQLLKMDIYLTTDCKIYHFCNDTCKSLASRCHSFRCIPSITPQESRSITVKSTCPQNILDEATSRLNQLGDPHTINVTGSYSLHFDAENFTTVRIRLKENVNSMVLFSTEAAQSTQYALIKNAEKDNDDNAPEVDCENEADFPHLSKKAGRDTYRDMPIILNLNFSGMTTSQTQTHTQKKNRCMSYINHLLNPFLLLYRHRGCCSQLYEFNQNLSKSCRINQQQQQRHEYE